MTTIVATFPTDIKLFGTTTVPVRWDAPARGSSTMASIMLGLGQAKNNEGTFLTDDDLQTVDD